MRSRPATLIFLRTAPAALLLAPIALHRGALAGILARWRWLLAFTAAELAIPWFFVGRAEIHLTSSVTGLLIASVPLVGAIIYRLLGYDHFDRRRILGLLIGFAVWRPSSVSTCGAPTSGRPSRCWYRRWATPSGP